VGILTLAYAALSMLVEVELAFNQIFHAPGGRSWGRRVTQYWTLLSLGPLLLVLSFAVGEQFKLWIGRVSTFDGSPDLHRALLTLAGFSVTVLISTLLLFIIYSTVPNTRVKFTPALTGAFGAAILWEFGKWGFRAYVTSGGTSKLYGALALVPLFMLWIYVTWLIVLAGLQLAFSLQMFGEVREMGEGVWDRLFASPSQNPAIVDGGVALPLMIVLAGRFKEGKPARAAELAEEFSLTEPVVLNILQRLTSAELLHRIDTGEESDRAFALSRPPEAISAEAVVGAGISLWDGAEKSRHADLIRTLQDSRVAAVRGKNLAQLVPPETPVT
jgi:membrane protein